MVLCFLLSIPLHLVAWSLDMLSLIISMLMIASCMFSFSSGDSAAVLSGLQSCLASVQSWMSTNKLKLNPDKTEFLLIGNERQRSKYLSMFPIELLGVETSSSSSLCAICSQQVGCHGSPSFSILCHSDTVII